MRTTRFFPLALVAALLWTFLSCRQPTDSLPDQTLSSYKSIYSFVFRKADNPDLAFDCPGTIQEAAGTISSLLPYCPASVVASLIPVFSTSSGASASPASGVARDFSSPVAYLVTAEDGSTKSYTVTVTVVPAEESSDSSLLSLKLQKDLYSSNLLSGFDPAILSYEVPVPAAVSSLRVLPTASYSAATITVAKAGSTPQTVASGAASTAIPLDFGPSTLQVSVTSFDRTTSTTYTLVADRGAPYPISVGAGWLPGTVTDTENISVGGGLWYSFAATAGTYYQVAVDAWDFANPGWTTANGGYGTAASASVYAAVYRADGTTAYQFLESPESTSYPDFFRGDRGIRYVTLLALDSTVKIRISGSSSYGTFALQVRERASFPSPTALSLRSWQTNSFPTDPWISQDVPTYAFTAAAGLQYRVGVDDNNESYDAYSGERGWSYRGFGVTTTPTARVQMRVLRADGETPYAYGEGDSGWFEADYYNTDTYAERKYATITALDTTVLIQVRGVSSYSSLWGEGSFAVQARPVVESTTGLSPGTTWTAGSFDGEVNAWDLVKAYTISTSAGGVYEIGVDDREQKPIGSSSYVCWDIANGGSPDVAGAYLRQRVLQSDGSVASYVQSWISPDAQGWVEADANMPPGPPDYRQRRYLTVASSGTTIRLELQSVIRFVTGTFAVQVRELPPPTSLIVDADWLLDTIGMPDGWDLTNLRLFSFAATPETTYYLMVDDKGGDWRTTNGGYTTEPTAYCVAAVLIADGSAYLPGYPYSFSYVDGEGPKALAVTATGSSVRLAILNLISDGGDGTYAIRVGTTAPP